VTRAAWVALALAAAGCRTEIKPLVKAQAPVSRPRATGCQVTDFQSGADVPAGAKNVGWVKVDRAETDEATFEVLRKAVCAQGANAFSQARWERAAGASVADPPVALEANAWALP
jgi:hypothetical protein